MTQASELTPDAAIEFDAALDWCRQEGGVLRPGPLMGACYPTESVCKITGVWGQDCVYKVCACRGMQWVCADLPVPECGQEAGSR